MTDVDKNTILFNGETFEKNIILRRTEYNSNCSEPKSFKEIFGDLSDSTYNGTLDLSRLNLNSLEGCPKRILGGDFMININSYLYDLNFFPEKLARNCKLYLGFHMAPFLKEVSINSYKNSIILFTGLLNSKKKDKLIVENLADFRKANGSFEKLRFSRSNQPPDYERLEKLYHIHKKVGFDQEKFERALELL